MCSREKYQFLLIIDCYLVEVLTNQAKKIDSGNIYVTNCGVRQMTKLIDVINVLFSIA